MKTGMKHLLRSAGIALAGFLLLAGCADETEGPLVGQLLTFHCPTQTTRAGETTTATITNFRVWGVWNKGDGGSVDGSFMESQIVEKQSSGDWVYSPERYLPTVGWVNFTAYSPAFSTGLQSFTLNNDGTVATITYSVPASCAQQEDFLVASNLGCTSGPVGLGFSHALSKVVVYVGTKVTDVSYRITGVEITGFNSKGTLTGSDTYGWRWTEQNTPVTYRLDIPSPIEVPILDDEGFVAPVRLGSLMALPQTVTDLRITLYYGADGSTFQTLPSYSGTFDMDKNYNIIGVML